MMKCRYRCAYSRGRKKERCVCVYKNGVGWRRALFFRSYRFVMINGKGHGEKRIKKRQREIQNAKWITNKKNGKKRFFFCPKNVDSLCRFHLPFLFLFFSDFSTEKFPIPISHRFRMFAVLTHFWGSFFFSRFRILLPPPLQGIEKKGPPWIAGQDLIRYALHTHTDDCVTKY